ncbi:MAG: Slp family lipoprotein [Betaproteobacteria bacterium]|nr:Slp family lipoprotein [Betaproteobacteria bacterium]
MKPYLILIFIFLGACTSLPPAIEKAQVEDISYHQISADLDRYKNTQVRWGGVVIGVENEENNSLMQVLFYPLDHYGRPQIDKPSAGHFVIKSTQFLDAEVYVMDREIVAVGTIDNEIGRTLDTQSTEVPQMSSTAIHLWPINYRGEYYGNCRSCYFRQLFW